MSTFSTFRQKSSFMSETERIILTIVKEEAPSKKIEVIPSTSKEELNQFKRVIGMLKSLASNPPVFSSSVKTKIAKYFLTPQTVCSFFGITKEQMMELQPEPSSLNRQSFSYLSNKNEIQGMRDRLAESSSQNTELLRKIQNVPSVYIPEEDMEDYI